jgi:hypothetical protein
MDEKNVENSMIVYPCKKATGSLSDSNVGTDDERKSRALYGLRGIIEHDIFVSKKEVDKIIKNDNTNVFINITKPSKIDEKDTFPAVASHTILYSNNPDLVSALHCNRLPSNETLYVSNVEEVVPIYDKDKDNDNDNDTKKGGGSGNKKRKTIKKAKNMTIKNTIKKNKVGKTKRKNVVSKGSKKIVKKLTKRKNKNKNKVVKSVSKK